MPNKEKQKKENPGRQDAPDSMCFGTFWQAVFAVEVKSCVGRPAESCGRTQTDGGMYAGRGAGSGNSMTRASEASSASS